MAKQQANTQAAKGNMVAIIAILGLELLGPVVVVWLELMVGSIVVMGLGARMGSCLGPVMGMGPGMWSWMVSRMGRCGMAPRNLYAQWTPVCGYPQWLYRCRKLTSRLAFQ